MRHSEVTSGVIEVSLVVFIEVSLVVFIEVSLWCHCGVSFVKIVKIQP